jgi:hypothetical protein
MPHLPFPTTNQSINQSINQSRIIIIIIIIITRRTREHLRWGGGLATYFWVIKSFIVTDIREM